MAPQMIRATVLNEDCSLHYWSLGAGPLILFIPGGNGHGRQYNALMTLLSPSYTCATFDRRQMSASVVAVNKTLNMYQAARDVVCIIHALGFEKATIFGSSMGGVIAFQVAVDFPEVVEHLICHEAPTIHVLEDKQEMVEYIINSYDVYRSAGLAAAQALWAANFTELADPALPPTQSPEEANPENFWANEILVGSYWVVDFEKIRKDGVSVGLMTGERTGEERFFKRAVLVQQNLLGCVCESVPGHHVGFEVESEAFQGALTGMLGRLEERRGMGV